MRSVFIFLTWGQGCYKRRERGSLSSLELEVEALSESPPPITGAMRTRRGVCYPKPEIEAWKEEEEGGAGARKRTTGRAQWGCGFTGNGVESRRKRPRPATAPLAEGWGRGGLDFFDGLPDDLVVSILCNLSASAASPSDLVSIRLTCKRLNGLGLNPLVLFRASAKSLAVKAKSWSESAHRFLKHCAEAGNLEACYTLGMIRFYCLENRGGGAALMARAAMGSHAAALYSLAVIQFNGSGGSKGDKDLRAGVALCLRAAFLGHVDALRELGHCLQDGYGVRQNVAEGRRFLVQANARELAQVLSTSASCGAPALHCLKRYQTTSQFHHHNHRHGCSLLSDFGCAVPAPEVHPANKFLAEWFGSRGGLPEGKGLRLCSHRGCGRPETRRHEFRRCSVCGTVNYCSRACQALHWKLAHKSECAPMEQWLDPAGDGGAAAAAEEGGGFNAGDGGGGDMNRDE